MSTTEPRTGAIAAGAGIEPPPSEGTMARGGMAASAHPFVSQVALDVLRHGGNAVDAAVAGAAVLMTVEPRNGHLGGDTFFLINPAGSREVVALNGSGAAPLAATAERYRQAGGIPAKGPWASTVPGTVHAWGTALARFGSRPLAELLAPAIAYARDGVPVTARLQRLLAGDTEVFRKYPDSAAVFLPGGDVPALGTLFRQPGLARSLERIAADGWEDFYRGQLAAELADYSASHGGLFSREDFAAHATEVAAPISIDYRGYTVFEQPPVSQGIIVLLALNILGQFDVAALGPASPELLHLQLEALKLAFADRLRYLGDPRTNDLPLAMLLSPEHAREQAARIDPDRARPLAWPGNVQPDTTYMCVADADGTMVSYIHSLFAGSGVVMGDTGVLMNNRMLGFNLDEGHPNCLAPGKRPVHTLNNYLVQRDGEPVLVGGTPGAHWQVQTNLQILTNVLDFGMDPQAATEAPRFLVGDQEAVGNPVVRVESRAGEATIDGLRARGHEVEVVGPWRLGGGVQLIARDPASGMYLGATDLRRPGNSVLGI
ncbi:MAG TPA: gamma-glutamyltransferase [Thermomicrobiaceae bacterium]|nr:gamma-glutamyltransferase [Thermomicrobiaceae bacterium]